MAMKCPHCSVDIEGALSQETHVARLKAKDDENKALRSDLTTAKAKAAEFDTVKAEHDRLKGEVTKRDQAAERGKAFESAKIAAPVRAGFELVYASETADLDEAPSFESWLAQDTTKAHPLLSGHYGTATTPAAGANTTTANVAGRKVPATGGLPHTDAGSGDPPGKPTKMTPQELQAYFQSPEFRAKPADKRKEERTALQAEYSSKV